jgi:hypothetical protein
MIQSSQTIPYKSGLNRDDTLDLNHTRIFIGQNGRFSLDTKELVVKGFGSISRPEVWKI